MFRYLNIRTSGSTNQFLPPGWWTTERALISNVNKAIEYYQTVPSFINTRHILIQFLTTLPINLHLDDFEYYNKLKLRSMDIANVLGMTSYRGLGKIHQGEFIGDNQEILLAINGDYNLNEIKDNWRMLSSTRFLRHDYTELCYPFLRGTKNFSTSGLSILEIDVTLLALQYREFKLMEETKSSITGVPEKSINQFIANYVIANLVPSFIDQVIINKYLSFSGVELTDRIYNKRTMFNTLDIESRLDDGIKKHIDQLRSSDKDIFTNLNGIPLINKDSVAHFTMLPKTLMNRFCLWAYLYAKLPELELGLRIGGQSVKMRNNDWLARFRTEMRYLYSDSVFRQSGNRSMERQITAEIKRIEDLLS